MEFVPGGVPVEIAAKVYGKSQQWVRLNMQNGKLPIGTVTKNIKRMNYYISPKLLYEHTGFIYRGGIDEVAEERTGGE